MNVNTMRRIDYWLGMPLCFIASVLRAPFGRRPGGTPRNTLFIELSEMGSAILVDPAMRKLRERTGCKLYFAIFASNRASLALLGTVPPANVYTIRDDQLLHLLIDTLKFPRWARRHAIDTVIDLELFSRFTALLTGFSGAANRVGYHAFHNEGLYRGRLLTHEVQYNPHQHIARNFVALVNAVLSSEREVPYSKTVVSDAEIRLEPASLDPAALQRMRDTLGELTSIELDPQRHKLVLINANASELLIQRRWPAAHYAALIQRIVATHPEALVLLTGAAGEHHEMARLRDRAGHERCINIAGRLRFEELPLLYALAQLMVTNDSGPAHFAAVTALRVYVLFGPETPDLYGSLGNAVAIYKGLACSPCVSAFNHRKTSCRDNVCLQSISPQEVYTTIEPALQAPPTMAARLHPGDPA